MLQGAHAQQLEQCERIFVGYSGGMDSHVLLHLLVQLGFTEKITALHLNHGYSSQAEAFSRHAEQTCNELGVDLICERTIVEPKAQTSLEAAFRDARYAFFEKYLTPNAVLALGHHADDQAETVLLRLLRGAGVEGLAAIPCERVLGQGKLLRPLLYQPRAKLAEYAEQQGLRWIEDQSNSDSRFDRNYLRHDVMPLLSKRWPHLQSNFSRSAAHCGETAQWLKSQAELLMAPLLSQQPYSKYKTLSVAGLLMLTNFEQRMVLRRWLELAPTEEQLNELLDSICRAAEDAQPEWQLGELCVRRFQGRLYKCENRSPKLQERYAIVDELTIPSLGRLALQPPVSKGAEIRFRRGGETIKPSGHQHSASLKNLLQEAAIPPWQRDRIPLLYIDNELVAVAGLCRTGAAPCELNWNPE